MCNLYSLTSSQEAMRRLFRIDTDRIGNLPPLPAIFPGQPAPVVRIGAADARELIRARWGFPLILGGKAPKAVTNARADKVRASRFWKGSFESRRCLVPATSFCEWTDRWPKVPHWFALTGGDETRPLFAFAGLWRRWRGTWKGEAVDGPVMAFLTTAANATVRPIHAKAMPVILTADHFDTWLDGSPDQAFALARPLADDRLTVIAKGETRDPA